MKVNALATVVARWVRKLSQVPPGIDWSHQFPRQHDDHTPPGGGTVEPGERSNEERAGYVHQSHDLGLQVVDSCVGQVLGTLQEA